MSRRYPTIGAPSIARRRSDRERSGDGLSWVVLFPPPIVVQLAEPPPGVHAWTPYVSPVATWDARDVPVPLAWATSPPPGIDARDAQAELDVAARAWSQPTCSAALFVLQPSVALVGDGARDGKNEVIVHTADWPAALEPGAVAHTVLWVVGTRIVEADVHVDAAAWSFAIGDVPGKLDLRAVLTHELGHALGIGHSEEPRATMAAGLPAGLAARSLEDDDVAAVCALYAAAPPALHGCDRGSPCPTGHSCIGHGCERADEPGTEGAPCAAGASHRCDGAGDRAWCIPTSLGERCALPCPVDPTDDCGATLDCANLDDAGGRACLPTGATVRASDAGGDAGGERGDATNDARGVGAETTDLAGGGSGCATGRARGLDPRGALLLVLAMLFRGRRR